MRTADLSKTTIAALHLVVHSHRFESLHHRNQSNRLALRSAESSVDHLANFWGAPLSRFPQRRAAPRFRN